MFFFAILSTQCYIFRSERENKHLGYNYDVHAVLFAISVSLLIVRWMLLDKRITSLRVYTINALINYVTKVISTSADPLLPL